MENNIILELDGISKSFPGVKALNKACLKVKKGEIHAVLGENGAGKSTLMKVLSGVYKPDEGTIKIDGTIVKDLTPLSAVKKGISIVYQELNLFAASSVAENIFVDALPIKNGRIDYKTLYKNTNELLERYNLTDLDCKQIVRNLSVGRQQLVEIMKAVSKNSKILILDEPTSALTEKETIILNDIIFALKNEGVSIIYISHRLEEIFGICDRATILRDGEYITTLDIKNTNKTELVKYMVGRDVAYEYGAGTSEVGETMLKVENLTYKNVFQDVSFELRSGEVIGVAGLEGSGRTELIECIFGLRKATGGKIFVKGNPVNIKNTLIAKKYGIAYITKDRKSFGLFMRLSVSKNIVAASIEKTLKNGFVNKSKIRAFADKYIKAFSIKTASDSQTILKLSGGNQQKVLLAMWLLREPSILLVDEPTRGVDVGTKEDIHKLIRDMAKKGMSVIMVSSDMPEIFGASDRVMTLYEGKVTGFLEREELDETKIMHLMSGILD